VGARDKPEHDSKRIFQHEAHKGIHKEHKDLRVLRAFFVTFVVPLTTGGSGGFHPPYWFSERRLSQLPEWFDCIDVDLCVRELEVVV
jgi:hypothetical protein